MAKRKTSVPTVEFDVKERRKAYGIHLSDLSKELGVSRHNLTKMEERKAIPIADYDEFHKLQPIMFPAREELSAAQG